MVEEKNGTVYVCSYCDREYDSYDDAEECSRDCVSEMRNEPIRKHKESTFNCEYCEEEYPTYSDAADCEQRHEKRKDKYYDTVMHERSIAELRVASQHPSQYKISRFF